MQNDLHEREEIWLKASDNLPRLELQNLLFSRGFKAEDDFYFLDRPDAPKPWQAISVMTIDVLFRGSMIKDLEEECDAEAGEWDTLRIEYLMASLPTQFIEDCAKECEAIASRFGLQIKLGNAVLERGQLQSRLQKIADNLASEVDEPGSEALGILIAQLY